MNEIASQAQQAVATAQAVPPGWYPDPTTHGNLRWWDGAQWSQQYVRPVGGAPATVPGILETHPHQSSKSLILGWIGVIWGGGILINHFLLSHPTGNAAYDSGTNFAALVGVAMLGAGLRALYRWYRASVR